MTKLNKQVVTPFTPLQMFELVSDIEGYPSFIPWVRQMKVSDVTDTDKARTGRARASVGFKGFSESFTTDVTARKDLLKVDVSLVEGPFRKLENAWTFSDHPKGCAIDFHIDFEFSNILLQMLLNANFDKAVQVLMNAFLAEAKRRYA